MDYKASKRLKIGTSVRFALDGVRGTVIETGYNAVKIAWDDGQTGIIHHDDMQDVSRDLGDEMLKAQRADPSLGGRLKLDPAA